MQSVVLHLHAFFIVDGGACVHAEHHILHFGVGLCQVVGIVGGDQRQTHFRGQIDRHFHALTLNLKAGILNLQVEAIAEDPHIPFHQPFCVVLVVCQQQSGQF